MADDDMIVLVEFKDGGTLRRVANTELDAEELAKLSGKSKDAVEKALATIHWVGARAKQIITEAHDRPDEVELEFGISITSKAGMLVVQGEAEFHIKAKLVWKKGSNG